MLCEIISLPPQICRCLLGSSVLCSGLWGKLDPVTPDLRACSTVPSICRRRQIVPKGTQPGWDTSGRE